MTMIQTRDLKKTFKGRRGTVEAVKGVDLRIEQGEILGFLGPNGAGKTTTLRMLTTLMPPSGGEATVAGHDLRRASDRVRERIGYVSQAGGSDLPMTLAPAWLRAVSSANPLKHAVDATRALFTGNLGDPSVARGLGIMAVLAVLAVWWAVRSFRSATA